MKSTLHYVHDPMCSWCWGFTSALDSLLPQLDESVQVQRVLGGLAPDSDEPMPAAMQAMLQQTWQRISALTPQTQFNFDFWSECQPKRSTWPACRAVLAAKAQGPDFEVPMIRAIQQAYYLQAQNPSNTDTLVTLANLIGCHVDRFEKDLQSNEIHESLLADIQLSRHLGAQGFPSLFFTNSQNERYQIAIDYNHPHQMLDRIEKLSIG